jgi:preprotein translocase subunit SecF
MFDIVGKRYWYFALSGVIILLGLTAMVISVIQFGAPFKMSIDFTGGALLELRFDEPVAPADVRDVFVDRGYGDTSVQTTADGRTALIRSKPLDTTEKVAIVDELTAKFGPSEELRFESVGPTVGREVTRAAAVATTAAAIVILVFIIFAFRKVPKAGRYGVCAIVAMLHDLLVACGFVALMGVVAGWEVDALFLTAILTVIGFSVQDTIVVFDRIRENTPKRRGEPFEVVVNRSLLETLHRSLATQLNAIFVLFSVFLFGGATIRQFVTVLLVGLISGTYSSIFNAVPLLVVWENGEVGRFFGRLFGKKPVAV